MSLFWALFFSITTIAFIAAGFVVVGTNWNLMLASIICGGASGYYWGNWHLARPQQPVEEEDE